MALMLNLHYLPDIRALPAPNQGREYAWLTGAGVISSSLHPAEVCDEALVGPGTSPTDTHQCVESSSFCRIRGQSCETNEHLEPGRDTI